MSVALALGAADATPLQMATGFATIINGGHRIQPYFNRERICNFDNETIHQANPQRSLCTCFNENLRQLMPNCLNYLKPINQRFLTRLAHQLAIGYNQALHNMSLPQAPACFPPNGL